MHQAAGKRDRKAAVLYRLLRTALAPWGRAAAVRAAGGILWLLVHNTCRFMLQSWDWLGPEWLIGCHRAFYECAGPGLNVNYFR